VNLETQPTKPRSASQCRACGTRTPRRLASVGRIVSSEPPRAQRFMCL
jgi:hypothetical protein